MNGPRPDAIRAMQNMWICGSSMPPPPSSSIRNQRIGFYPGVDPMVDASRGCGKTIYRIKDMMGLWYGLQWRPHDEIDFWRMLINREGVLSILRMEPRVSVKKIPRNLKPTRNHADIQDLGDGAEMYIKGVRYGSVDNITA